MRCHAAFWAFVQQHGTAHAVTIATRRDEDVAKTTKWLLNRQGKQLRNLWLALAPAERQELMEATPDPTFPTTENGIYDERQDRKIRYFQELRSAQQAASSANSAESRINNSAPAETSLISSAASTSEEVQSSRLPPRTRSRGVGRNEAGHVTNDMSAELSAAEDLSSGETSAQGPRPKRRKTLVTRSKKSPGQAPRLGRQLHVPSVRGHGQQMVSGPTTVRRSYSQQEGPVLSGTTHELNPQPEVTGYEMALSARGWRAQLLKDVDLHLLRAVAEIAGCLESTEGLNSSEAVGIDSTQALRELETAAGRVQAAQRRLSSLVATTIAQAESLSGVEGANSLHGINSPRFVSTGQGSLVLMSDIERYLLLMSDAVRRYRRSIGQRGLSGAPGGQAEEAADLWPLQLHIEVLMAELKELSASIYAQAKRQLAGT